MIKIFYIIMISLAFIASSYSAEKELKAKNEKKDNKILETIKKGAGKLNTESKLTDWIKEKMKK